MEKISYNKRFSVLISIYLVLWVFIPASILQGIPLDSSEILGFGTPFQLGNYKHPELPVWILKVLLPLFPNVLSCIFTLSAICILVAFFYVYKLGVRYLKPEQVLLALLFTSTIYYYNVRSLQYNHNIMMLPFWCAVTYYFVLSIEDNKLKNWIILGIVSGLALLSKYESILLIFILVCYLLVNFQKKYIYPFILSTIIALFVFSPNLYWLINHDFLPLRYTEMRAGLNGSNTSSLLSHLTLPFKYFIEQIGLLIYPVLFCWIFGKRKAVSDNKTTSDKSNALMLMLALAPFVLVFFLSMIFALKIPAEWSYPFYLFSTLGFVKYLNIHINRKNLNIAITFVVFVHVCILSVYLISMHFSRNIATTNRPAKSIAHQAIQLWNDKVKGYPLRYTIGDAYFIGLIPGYTSTDAQPLLDFSFVATPYLDKKTFESKGAVGFMNGCPKEVPVEIKNTLKNNKISQPYCYSNNAVNTFHHEPYHYSLYIVYPSEYHIK